MSRILRVVEDEHLPNEPHGWSVYELHGGTSWDVCAAGFRSVEEATAWQLNELDDTKEWKMPAWMVPHCGTEYLQDVKTVIWHMNDKTPVQVNAPLALFAEHTAGEVRMLERLHKQGRLCPPGFMRRLESYAAAMQKDIDSVGHIQDDALPALKEIIAGSVLPKLEPGTLGYMLDLFGHLLKSPIKQDAPKDGEPS